MAHIAWYRSWRSQAFREMVGQQHIIQTLQNALKEQRLAHAYLFSGPRGTGKTSAAKILAKAVNCLNGPAAEPCNECSACLRITEGSVMDVVEIDAASNRGVEEIRDIRDKVKYAPTEVRQKVYIIDEVHMLTTEAFNALLKTLEEPPAHVMFVLATTEPHKLPATIISRCQRFDFRRVALEEQVERLALICREEGVDADRDALQLIARLSDGGMRDAISLLDQTAAFAGGRIAYADVVSMTGGMAADQFAKLAEAIKDKDVGRALQLIDELMQEGKSADKCMESLILFFRDLLLIKLVPNSQAVTDRILDVSGFAGITAAFANDELFALIDTLNKYQVEMKYAAQPQTLFEVAVMKICSASEEAAPAAADAVRAPTPAGGAQVAAAADAGEVARLQQRLQQVERQLAQLAQQQASGGGAAGAAGGTAAPRAAAAPAAPAAALRRSGVKLDAYLKGKDSPLFRQAMGKWGQVLAQVKEQKVTVHAWLMNGEPVSFDSDTMLLAFKNAIHRETTEKPDNRQLIEQVMSAVFGHPTKLATVMQKEWNDAAAVSAAEPEVLQPTPDEPDRAADELVTGALSLFGEQLVKVTDE
ncbi:DNA polymerase III subunit gamma/tau [Paenibacillus cymbidii]|uniref:DNA polymerase III subunit gamma/tau n=1 Tax=Paenibacillus cymbidii TaxID=1639034 RepID=UPI0010817447|nr:DNA polymerase III subunit gamma/tau [Paenibacillus cymbidii]